MKKTQLRSLCLLAALLPLWTAVSCGGGDTAPSPAVRNILLITVDTWRYDRVGLHGRFVKTPHIDRLAAESLRFTRAFSHTPCTLPAHANILTGTTPLSHGISDNSGFRLKEDFLTLAEFFREKNWHTAAFIAAFPLDSRFGLDQGFELYDEQYQSHSEHEGFFSERPANELVDSFIAWKEKLEDPKNWFAWIHLFDPHQPYFPPEPFASEYPDDPYSGEVAYTDQELGRLWQWMRGNGVYDNTLIVLTADHGEGLGDHGERTHAYFAYNSTIHVPLFIRIPGTRAAVVEENVCHVDIFPTLCQALGMEPPEGLHGLSLLSDHSVLASRSIYFESLTPYYNRNWAPLRGYLLQNEKYIDLPIQELYDIGRDPDESQNRVQGLNWKSRRQKLERLISSHTRPVRPERQKGEKPDPEAERRLQSLGYIPSDRSLKKTSFLPQDDLKLLLPLQNLMLDGLTHEQNERDQAALGIYTNILRQREDFILVYTLMAAIFKKNQQYQKAVEILNHGLAANPDNIFLLSKLGILLSEYGRPEEAVTVLNRVLSIEDTDPETYTYLGVAYHRMKKFDQAMTQFERGLKLDRSNALLHNNIAAVTLEKFLKTRDRSLFDRAMDSYNRALEADPVLHSALNGRGAAFSFDNQPDRAMADWFKALSAKKDYPDPYFNLGILLARSGDSAKALEIFQACRQHCQRTLTPADRQRLERLISRLGQ